MDNAGMPAQRAFPDMDIDLERAVRRVAAALLSPAGPKAARLRASDAEVFDVLDRVVDIMTDPGSAPESAALAFALDLLWPRTVIDGLKLIKTVEATLRPGAKLKERKAAYSAARAVLSAWNVTDGHAARPGRPEDLRGPAETMLQAFGMKLERIAEFTEPQVDPPEGADLVKHRIYRYLKRERAIHGGTVTPAALTFRAPFAEENGTKPIEIRPVTQVPRAGRQKARRKLRDHGRKRGKQKTD
jgi:hypothetical protein